MTYPNDIKTELIGMHALNSFVAHDSASRAVMLSSHFGQKLTLIRGDESRIQTGAEKEFAKYTFSVKMPANARIIQVVDRYPVGLGKDAIPHNPESYIIYEDLDTTEIGCLCVPSFISHHQYFGYLLKPTSNSANLTPGTVLKKGTVLFDSPAVTDNGGYAYGVELNLALMNHPAVAEDSILISEDVLPRLEFDVFERRVIEFGTKTYPLNIYGTPTNYKPFPEIGEMVGKHRILMMLREMDVDLCPVDMSIYDVCEPDFTHDTPIYGRGTEGQVIDIKVYHDEDVIGPTPVGMTEMLDKYARAYKQFCRTILDIEHKLRYEYKKKYGQDKLPISVEFHQLVKEALVVLDPYGDRKAPDGKKHTRLNKEYRKEPLQDYRVEMVIRYRIRPTVGFKLSGHHGN